MKNLITPLALLSALVFASHTAHAGTTQASFTPTGYRYPVMKISVAMADGTNEQNLFTCTGATSAECMIDLADPVALHAIELAAADVTIRSGTYTRINLENCPAGSSGSDMTTISVSGTATTDTGTFATSASAAGGMSAGTTPAFTDIPWACGGAHVTLQQPLVVTDGSSQALSLLVDLTYALWTDANATDMGGCKSDFDPLGQDVCGSFPLVVPFVGTGTPTFERYLISHLAAPGTPALADANGAVMFGVDASNNVFYVGDQPFYSTTSPSFSNAEKGGADYNASVRTFSTNSDASIAFQAGGDITDNRVGFSAFARSTHQGTCKDEALISPTWYYKAFKQ